MKIGITAKNPYIFPLALAHLLKNKGSVNIKTGGIYSNILFEGEDDKQERDGVFFNDVGVFDYELFINDKTPCDYRIIVSTPSYLEGVEFSKNRLPLHCQVQTEEKCFLVISNTPLGLRYKKDFFISTYKLPEETSYIEIPITDKDLLTEYYFGISPMFSLDNLSKSYISALIEIYNKIHGTNYKKDKTNERG